MVFKPGESADHYVDQGEKTNIIRKNTRYKLIIFSALFLSRDLITNMSETNERISKAYPSSMNFSSTNTVVNNIPKGTIDSIFFDFTL